MCDNRPAVEPHLTTPHAVASVSEAAPIMTSAPPGRLKEQTPLANEFIPAMAKAVPYNILSLDGGGARGAMEAVILDDVMNCLTLIKRGELQEDWVTEHFGNGRGRTSSGTKEASGVVMRGDPQAPIIRRSMSLPMSRLSSKVSVMKNISNFLQGAKLRAKLLSPQADKKSGNNYFDRNHSSSDVPKEQEQAVLTEPSSLTVRQAVERFQNPLQRPEELTFNSMEDLLDEDLPKGCSSNLVTCILSVPYL